MSEDFILRMTRIVYAFNRNHGCICWVIDLKPKSSIAFIDCFCLFQLVTNVNINCNDFIYLYELCKLAKDLSEAGYIKSDCASRSNLKC